MPAVGIADVALVRRAIGEVAVVVVGRERLEQAARDADRAAQRADVDLLHDLDTRLLAERLDQVLAEVPERAAEDHPGLVDLADVLGPAVLMVRRIDVAQRLVRVEEADAHLGIARDLRGEEVGRALAHRGVERAHTHDDLGRVHRVAELVEHDVLDQAGVLTVRRCVEEVDRLAVEERVAVLGEVDVGRHLIVERGHVG